MKTKMTILSLMLIISSSQARAQSSDLSVDSALAQFFNSPKNIVALNGKSTTTWGNNKGCELAIDLSRKEVPMPFMFLSATYGNGAGDFKTNTVIPLGPSKVKGLPMQLNRVLVTSAASSVHFLASYSSTQGKLNLNYKKDIRIKKTDEQNVYELEIGTEYELTQLRADFIKFAVSKGFTQEEALKIPKLLEEGSQSHEDVQLANRVDKQLSSSPYVQVLYSLGSFGTSKNIKCTLSKVEE